VIELANRVPAHQQHTDLKNAVFCEESFGMNQENHAL